MALSKEKMIAAIIDFGGNLTEVSREIGCSLRAIYNYRDQYPDVAEAIEFARETYRTATMDNAETKLDEHVENGAPWAIKYVLSTLGKSRGYTTKQEVNHIGARQIIMQMDIGEIDDE